MSSKKSRMVNLEVATVSFKHLYYCRQGYTVVDRTEDIASYTCNSDGD